MAWWGIAVITIAVCLLLFLAVLGICFYMAFYAAPRKDVPEDTYPMPVGAAYEPLHDRMKQWMRQMRQWPHEDVEIRSFDGHILRGSYYECRAGAPIELMMPGYRGTALRDLCGGVERAFLLGHNVLVVDQRGGGKSSGRVITFGILERHDCLSWVRYLCDRFSDGQEILLTGISMGAATVMMASELPLPPNVKGVLADCGYTSAKDIMHKVIGEMHLPVHPTYELVRFSGRLFGGFDIESASPVEAMRHCRIPVVFIHGEDDGFVPCDMSRQNYEACAAEKELYTVKGADHGLAYPIDPEGYKTAMRSLLPCGEGIDMQANLKSSLC